MSWDVYAQDIPPDTTCVDLESESGLFEPA